MLIGVTNKEFLAHNASRSYPLSEHATKQPKVGAADFTLPDNFLVAAKIAVNSTPSAVDLIKFYISDIIIYSGGVRLMIRYGSEEKAVGAVTAIDNGQLNTTFPIIGRNDFYGLTGHVTIGTFDQVREHLGRYEFEEKAACFDPDVVSYSAAAVSSITIIENGIEQTPIYGDIKIVAGDNIKILTQQGNSEQQEQHTVLRIEREPVDFVELTRGIRTINGIEPSSEGNFDLISSTSCLQIEKGLASLTLHEDCCEPCCGCDELATLTNSIKTLMQANNDIRMYQQQLLHQLNSLAATVNITGV